MVMMMMRAILSHLFPLLSSTTTITTYYYYYYSTTVNVMLLMSGMRNGKRVGCLFVPFHLPFQNPIALLPWVSVCRNELVALND
ncbi:hypothetical protein IWX91DRAFT_48174 [Phyllosticta citricarpa]